MKSTSVSKTFLLVGVPIALVLMALIYAGIEFRNYLFTAPRFAVKNVEVLTEGPASVESVLRLARISPGTNLFSIDLEEVRKRVEKDPWIYTASVTRSLPNKIQIRYEKQTPVAILGADSMYYLNKEGVPFVRIRKGESLKYPLIQVEDQSKDVENSRKRVSGIMDVLNQIRASSLFSEKDLGDLSVRLGADEGEAPYWLTMRFPPEKLATDKKRVSRLYALSLGENNLAQQIKHWEGVVRYLAQQGKNPKLIRLELGKKVVVKVER